MMYLGIILILIIIIIIDQNIDSINLFNINIYIC